MTSNRPSLLILLTALAVGMAYGCSDQALNDNPYSEPAGTFPDEDQEGIVFVGTVADFTGNVYVVNGADTDTELINLTPRPESAIDDDELYLPGTMLSASAPFGVPGPQGNQVAFVTVPEQGNGRTMGRVSLARENYSLNTSPSIEGLQRVSFDPYGVYLLLTLVDDESGDVTLQVMTSHDEELLILNEDLGPAAVTDLQFEGPGAATDTMLVSGSQGEDGRTGIWEVPLPDGPVELLTSELTLDALNPAISPDSAYMAAELYDHESTRSDIAIYSFAEAGWTVITEGEPMADFRSPQWEPSANGGNRIAFLRYEADSDEDRTFLYVAPEDSEWGLVSHDLDDMLQGNRRLSNLRWSPSGGEILLDYRATNNASGLNETELVLFDVDRDMGTSNPYRLGTDGEPELAHWGYLGRTILLWDRSVTTQNNDGERTPIRIYEVDAEHTRNVSIESSEDDPLLYIDYPLFLSRNTLWYP